MITITKNDKKAHLFIIAVSLVVFAAVTALSRIELNVQLGFDKHLFAKLNAIINSVVTILLIAGLAAIKLKNQKVHKNIMLTAMLLSILFLVSYICHHLFTGETRYGDINHDQVISEAERLQAGSMRMVYYLILLTHIPLAGIILPFILYTAYRALIGEYPKHRKLAKITWPVWLYVSITGVAVYFLISPYYT